MSTATARQNVVWEPTEKQAEFISASEREVLLGGGLGAAKSSGLLLSSAYSLGNSAHRALIVRKSFPQLRDLIGRSLEIFPYLGGIWNEAKSTWKFPSGSRIEFGYLDGPQDHSRYLGREMDWIGVDELCEWESDATDANGEPVSSDYLFLMSRLRTTKASGLPLEMRATCVPTGPGKNWVQNRWQIQPDGGPTRCVDPATGLHRRFIRALLADNPHLAGSAYEQTLRSLSEAKRKAYLLGRWDSFEGQIFEEFSDAHICQPFAVPVHWPIWRGGDDGYSSPACVVWLAHDPLYDRLYVTSELYQSRLTAEELAKAVIAIDATYEQEVDGGVLDSAAWADIGNGSRAQRMNEFGCGWQQAEKGPGSRVAGIQAIHSRLALKSDGSPGMRFFSTCRHAIQAVRSATYQVSGNPEDTDLTDDHALDAIRYGIGKRKVGFRLIRLRGI